MGGAIAVRVAAEQIIPTLVGLIIIDVVEGRLSMCALSVGILFLISWHATKLLGLSVFQV